jgi:hypothetical protein
VLEEDRFVLTVVGVLRYRESHFEGVFLQRWIRKNRKSFLPRTEKKEGKVETMFSTEDHRRTCMLTIFAETQMSAKRFDSH